MLDALAALLAEELVDLERVRRSLLLEVSVVLLASLLCSLGDSEALCVRSSALMLQQAREPRRRQLADGARRLKRLLLGLQPVVLTAQLHELRLVGEAALVAQRQRSRGHKLVDHGQHVEGKVARCLVPWRHFDRR